MLKAAVKRMQRTGSPLSQFEANGRLVSEASMDISKLTLEELLKLRHQISSRISVLRQVRTELRREHRRTILQKRAQNIRSQIHNGDTVFFRLGLQSYTGTIKRKAEKNAAIEFYDPFAKHQKSHYVLYERIRLIQLKKGEHMPIAGNVYWIEKGVQTIKVVDAEYAFRDPEQAQAQVQWAEASGNKKQIRLARLAYRQYQGMRYRGENKTQAKSAVKRQGAKKVGERNTALKPPGKKVSPKRRGKK